MNAIKVDCSNGLLTTDIALLAVDETHAVFSIRIERAKLAENHFFLNVVSDIAGGSDGLNVPPPAMAPKSQWCGAPAAWGWVSWISRRSRSGEDNKRA
jgi:hypothetical protein